MRKKGNSEELIDWIGRLKLPRNAGEQLLGMNYDIHVGAIFGLPGKLLVFFTGLIIASFPLTGFLMWWGRNKEKLKKKNRPGNTAHPKKKEKQYW